MAVTGLLLLAALAAMDGGGLGQQEPLAAGGPMSPSDPEHPDDLPASAAAPGAWSAPAAQLSPAEQLEKLPPHLRDRFSDLPQRPKPQAAEGEQVRSPDRTNTPPTRRRLQSPAKRAKGENPQRQEQPARAPKRVTKADRAVAAGPPAEQGPNRLMVADQTTNGSRISVANVVTELPQGFVTVRRMTASGPGPVLGVAQVSRGRTTDLVVPLNTPLTSSAELFVAIHSDNHERGVYQEGPDRLLYGTAGPVAQVISFTKG